MMTSGISSGNADMTTATPSCGLPSASQRELSQDGPSAPKTIHKKLLTSPHSPFSIQWIEIKVGNAGTAQGRTKISSSTFVHQPGRMKKPDSSSAKNSFTFTPNARKTMVLTTVFMYIGSEKTSVYKAGLLPIHR